MKLSLISIQDFLCTVSDRHRPPIADFPTAIETFISRQSTTLTLDPEIVRIPP
jgi:hypothetical protein